MGKRWMGVLLGLLALPALAHAQISPTYTFTDGTVISSAQVNANFALLANALNRTGGTMTGTLTSRDLVPSTTATYDLGLTGSRYRDGWLSRNLTVGGNVTVGGTFGLPDTNASHSLLLAAGSNITSDRTLTFTTGDASRTITLSGSPTLNDWFDQNVKTTATPSFNGATLTGSRTAQAGLSVLNTVTGSGTNVYTAYIGGTLNPLAGEVAAGLVVSTTINEAGSGNHSFLAGQYLPAPTITSGAATVSNAATLYVGGAPSATVSGGAYAVYVASGVVRFGGAVEAASTLSVTGATTLSSTLGVTGLASFTAGIRELGRTFNAGDTQTVTHSASNFTGSGSMTWTVASGDQRTFSYRRLGDTAWVTLDLTETSISGTPSTALNVTLPVAAAESVRVPCYYADNGTPGIGFGIVSASSAVLSIYKAGAANWTASTNLTDVACHLALKVS